MNSLGSSLVIFLADFLASIGRAIITISANTGRFALFVVNAISHTMRPPFFWRLFFIQAMRIGYYSLPVVALTAFFTGAVFALQIHYGGNNLNSETIIATIVTLGITRELGPVLTGLMVAGRISAAIAAELGSMRVTEQIDALITLSTNPYKYLVAPRLLAAIVTLPLLVLIADAIGIMGGFIVGTQALGFSAGVYLKETIDFLSFEVIRAGMIKGAVFGFIIALIGSFQGFHSEGGAQGVGRAVTSAVVISSILILASNYIMTSIFFSG